MFEVLAVGEGGGGLGVFESGCFGVLRLFGSRVYIG